MKDLIFINLLIDQIWAKDEVMTQLFIESNPVSLRLAQAPQSLGLFLARSDSVLLTGNPIDQDFWAQFSPFGKRMKDITVRNYSRGFLPTASWIDQLSLVLGQEKFRSLVAAGESELESRLRERFVNPSIQENSNLILSIKNRNRKSFLFDWCREKSIPFPESYLKLGNELAEILTDSWLAKSDYGSGGNGIVDAPKLKTIQFLAQKKNLLSEFERSRWLVQKKCHRVFDFSCYGRVGSPHSIVETLYDKNGLSYKHSWKHILNLDQERQVHYVYSLLCQELEQLGYQGEFGFDGFLSDDGFYPITDLNVRTTKTHLLHSACDFWQLDCTKTQILRFRFINNLKVSLNQFWISVTAELGLNQEGLGFNRKFLPIEVSSWSDSLSEVTLAIECPPSDLPLIEKVVSHYLKGYGENLK